MTGDPSDILGRLKAALPLRWFPDATPILDGLLTGLAAAWAAIYAQLAYVRLQTRVRTLTDGFLDLAATDYFGDRVSRRPGELDALFGPRILRNLLRDRATRTALAAILTDLTGNPPTMFEPSRPADTGAWNGPSGYGAAGGYGSLAMPFQCLVTVRRPSPTAGGTAVPDDELDATVAATVPAAVTAWTQLTG